MKTNFFSHTISPLPPLYCFVAILGFFLLAGCGPSSETEAFDVPLEELIDPSLVVVPPDSLVLSKVRDLDSLSEVLMPLLLSDPASRKFDLWFEQKSLWIKQIGTVENLGTYLQYFHDLYLKDGHLNKAATIAYKKGRILYSSGLYPEAIEAFKTGLTNANAIGDSTNVGWAYLGIASSNFRLGDSTETYQYAQKAKEIVERTADIGQEVSIMLTVVGIEGSMGHNTNVIPEMKAWITIARENKFYEIEKLGLLNLSYIYYLRGEYDNSIKLLLNNPTLNSGPISLNNTFLNFNLYEAYTGKKDDEKAFKYLQKGCEIADSLSFAYGINFCKFSQYEYYERTGDYQAALIAFKDYYDQYEKESGLAAQQKSRQLRAELDYNYQQLQIEKLSRQENEQRIEYRSRRNLLYAAIAVLILLLLIVFQRLRYNNRLYLVDQKRDVAETKLQVLQSQIQPHFIFNVITGIQNSILKSDPMKAYNYLGKFASLLRIQATSSNSISIPVDKEVELIENYLALEKLRFREGFVYQIDVEEVLLNHSHRIPSMMIQPVVENAIIHGVSNLSYQGEIKISMKQNGDGVEVVVEDNGRGREEAIRLAKEATSKHLSIASENREASLKYLRTIGYENAKISVKDLYEKNGVPSGTQVRLFLPYYREKTIK